MVRNKVISPNFTVVENDTDNETDTATNETKPIDPKPTISDSIELPVPVLSGQKLCALEFMI